MILCKQPRGAQAATTIASGRFCSIYRPAEDGLIFKFISVEGDVYRCFLTSADVYAALALRRDQAYVPE